MNDRHYPVADYDPQEALEERLQDVGFYQDIIDGENFVGGQNDEPGELARLLSWLGRDYVMAKGARPNVQHLAHSAMAARIEVFFRQYIEPRAREE